MVESIGSFLADSSKIYLGIAVFGTVLFVVQFILTMMGLHDGDTGGDGFEVDAHDIGDIHGISVFSLKSIVAFIAFFGWGGYFWGYLGWGGLGIATLCGLFMMGITVLLISMLLKLQQSGNLRPVDFIGQRGTVYLSVPAGRAPGGMVTVILPDRTRQVHVRSDEAIKTGEDVVIDSCLGGDIYLVRRSVPETKQA